MEIRQMLRSQLQNMQKKFFNENIFLSVEGHKLSNEISSVQKKKRRKVVMFLWFFLGRLNGSINFYRSSSSCLLSYVLSLTLFSFCSFIRKWKNLWTTTVIITYHWFSIQFAFKRIYLAITLKPVSMEPVSQFQRSTKLSFMFWISLQPEKAESIIGCSKYHQGASQEANFFKL
jgi:hypothetical protein